MLDRKRTVQAAHERVVTTIVVFSDCDEPEVCEPEDAAVPAEVRGPLLSGSL